MKAKQRGEIKRKMPMWLYPGVGMVLAWTRGEARAVVKKHLKVDRLPAGRTCLLISKGGLKPKEAG